MRFSTLFKAWLPVLLWMALMFTASTDLMSSEHTSRFIVPFLRWLKPDMSWSTLVQVHFFIRKCAHLTEYAILAIFLWRGLRLGHPHVRRTLWPQAALALAIAIGFAVFDEFHQSFVPTRGSSGVDVMIDSAGALLGLALRWGISRRAPD